MRLGVRSLSEDSVDVFTNFWSVIFFLFLTFVLLFVPVEDKQKENNLQQPQFKYVADCWCPAQFEDAQVKYANTFCSSVYNYLKLKGIDPHSIFKPIVHFEHENGNSSEEVDDKDKPQQDERNQNPFHLQSPYIVFVLAASLVFPRLLWSILSRCFVSVNVGQTLESAERGDAMDFDDRRRTFTALVQAFTKYTRTSKTTATCLYLLMKVLVIAVLASALIAINICITPTHQERAESGSPNKTDGEAKLNSSATQDASFSLEHAMQKDKTHFDILHCSYLIRQMQNTHEYTVQCMITERQQKTPPPSDSPIHSNVFLIVQFSVLLLLVVNTLNTLGWLIWLLGGSRKERLGAGQDCPLDLMFLIEMARTNLSVGVAVQLAECARGGVGPTMTKDEEMHLIKS